MGEQKMGKETVVIKTVLIAIEKDERNLISAVLFPEDSKGIRADK